MELGKILEYQKIDRIIYKAESELARSEEAKKAAALRKKISEAQQTLLNFDKETAEIFQAVEKLDQELKTYIAEENADVSITNVNSVKGIESVEKALSEYQDRIIAIEKDIKKCFKRLSDISSEANKQLSLGNQCGTSLKKVKELQSVKINEMKEKYKNELNELNAIRKEIDPEVFALYKALRDNRKMPPFAAYENKSCSGCGMDIYAEVDAKLNNPGDTAECPQCRRIVYKA